MWTNSVSVMHAPTAEIVCLQFENVCLKRQICPYSYNLYASTHATDSEVYKLF